MFSEIKAAGRRILQTNYSALFILHMLSFLITSLPLSLGINKIFGGILALFLPTVFTVLIYKNCINVMDGVRGNSSYNYEFLKSPKKLLNLFLICIVPNLINVIGNIYTLSIAQSPEAVKSLANASNMWSIVLSVFSLIIGIFFAGGFYYFARYEADALTALKVSFNVMKSRFFNYILFLLSFIGWQILASLLASLVGNIFYFLFSGLPALATGIIAVIIANIFSLMLAPYISACTAVYFKQAFDGE